MYMHNIFAVEPNSSSLIFDVTSEFIPTTFKNFEVTNVGRTKFEAKLIYGNIFSWIDTVHEATVEASEKKILNNGGLPYYRLGLKIINDTDTRAVVCASYTDGKYPGVDSKEIKADYDRIIKGMVVFGAKFLPYAGPTLSGLLGAFWPENKPNVWEQIRDKVQDLVHNTMLEKINHVLSEDIRQYQARITELNSHIDDFERFNVARNYMSLAQDMIGLELKFTFPKDDFIAFALLPLYSAVVMMKMNYYALGVSKPQELALTEKDVDYLKNCATTIIEGDSGVVTYLNQMYKERLDDIYAAIDVRDIYNAMMNTRSYIAVNGLEYVPLWKSILQDFSSTEAAYVDTISYSEFHGRKTPNLCLEATPESLQEPLTPELVNGKRNKLVAVELHIWSSDNGSPKIGGINVFFESGDSYMMGGATKKIIHVNFNGAFLKKLRVAGRNALDILTFYFSDGREETYGTPSGNETYYELKDHHIASVFLSNDSKDLGGQAANFAVSYEQDY